jgi:hypothetical protein
MLRGNCSFGFTSPQPEQRLVRASMPYPKPSALRVRLRVGFISSPVGSVVVHFVGPLTRSSSPCRANTGMIDHRGEGGSAGTAPWASSQRTRSTAWFGSWVSGYARRLGPQGGALNIERPRLESGGLGSGGVRSMASPISAGGAMAWEEPPTYRSTDHRQARSRTAVVCEGRERVALISLSFQLP